MAEGLRRRDTVVDDDDDKVRNDSAFVAEDDDDEEEEMESVERAFESQEVPSWKGQLTVRAFVVSLLLCIVFCFISMKLNLSAGVIPSMNIAAGLLGYFFIRIWTTVAGQFGAVKPFTRQENTVIQTCVIASSGITFSGGFGGYLFGMSERIANQSPGTPDAKDFKNPSLPWMIGFLFLVSFAGLLSLVPLRKIMIVDFKLTYPTGTATAYLINSFHTPQGSKLATKQVRELGKYSSISFIWAFFKWFFAAGGECGFEHFPTFGLQAYAKKFYFDFSAMYVGVGMLCPYLINISVLLGGILSWAIMWPLIETKAGDWYPRGHDDMHRLQGYKVFIAIAMILGDGLYNFVKVLSTTLVQLSRQIKEESLLPVASDDSPENISCKDYDERKRTETFLKDGIPGWYACAAFAALAAIAMGSLPQIFPQLRWYYVLVVYVIALPLAFCNAYGCGLTDWSLASTYGKLAIFIVGAWAGSAHGGVLAGLAACGVMMNIVSTASDLTQDFKTGFLTRASPRSMFISQAIGTAMGCVISPCVFLVFYRAFPDLGLVGSEYPAPFAAIYRSIARLGAEGFSSLPRNCLILCNIFFAAAVLINGARDLAGNKWARFIPIPMAMAIPFYIGSYFAIDMCVGCLILFVWSKLNEGNANIFAPAVASGLICGEGIWSLPSSVLALARVNPPICMKFLSSAANMRVDKFLES